MPSASKKQHNLMAAVANNPKFAKQVGIKQSVGEDFMKADKGRKFAKGGVSRHDDEAMDKKMIKKAVTMHDKQLHGGKKTDLAKLKKGGKIKKYEDGGLTFADMPEEDRAASARAAMDSINARQAEASEAAGGASTMKTTPRRPMAPKAPAAKPTVKSVSVTKEEVTGAPAAKPKTSLESYSERSPWNTRGTSKGFSYSSPASEAPKGAMPDVDARKAATESRQGRPAGKLSDLITGKLAKGGMVSSASKRADGCATKGKTKGTMVKMCCGGYAKKGK